MRYVTIYTEAVVNGQWLMGSILVEMKSWLRKLVCLRISRSTSSISPKHLMQHGERGVSTMEPKDKDRAVIDPRLSTDEKRWKSYGKNID
jgi:hypothetical protein